MLELADRLDSGSSSDFRVRVQVPSSALDKKICPTPYGVGHIFLTEAGALLNPGFCLRSASVGAQSSKFNKIVLPPAIPDSHFPARSSEILR